MKPELATSSDEDEANNLPWKKIERCGRKAWKNIRVDSNQGRDNHPDYETFDGAEKWLTAEEWLHILNRKGMERQAQTQEQARSRDKGTSKDKGIDPRNWGDINVSESKIDFDAQYKALKEWAEAKNWSQRDWAEPTRSRSDGRDLEEQTLNLLEQAIRAVESRITKMFEDKISQLNSEINKRDVLLTRQAKALDKARLSPKSKNPVEVMVEKAA
jgi:hypothetical protein